MEKDKRVKYCERCEYKEDVVTDGTIKTRCKKGNCLAIYSSCFLLAALEFFESENPSRKPKEGDKNKQTAIDLLYGREF